MQLIIVHLRVSPDKVGETDFHTVREIASESLAHLVEEVLAYAAAGNDLYIYALVLSHSKADGRDLEISLRNLYSSAADTWQEGLNYGEDQRLEVDIDLDYKSLTFVPVVDQVQAAETASALAKRQGGRFSWVKWTATFSSQNGPSSSVRNPPENRGISWLLTPFWLLSP